MKISINWLERHIHLDRDRFLNENPLLKLGIEIVHIEYQNLIESCTVLKTQEITDKLTLCEVILDSNQIVKQVVCGAKVTKNSKALYAHVGTKILDRILEVKKIFGHESYGMLLASSEVPHLNFTSSENDIINPSAQYFYYTDIILTIEFTSNRWDFHNIRGIARQLSFLGYGTLKKLDLFIGAKAFPVEIRNFTSVKASFISINNIKVHQDIIDLLNTIGVYKTNQLDYLQEFVILDIGHPIHIYDKTDVDSIVITKADKEVITDLKGNLFYCTNREILINNSKEIISIGGIIGVKGYVHHTKDIIIEACWFNPFNITSLHTQSGKIFNLGIDSELTTLEYLSTLVRGDISKVHYSGNPILDHSPIFLSHAYFTQITGLARSLEDLELKLIAQGCKVELLKKQNDLTGDYGLHVLPPSYRTDLKDARSLIEELLLHENLSIDQEITILPTKPIYSIENSVRNILIQCGFSEMYNMDLQSEPTSCKIINSMSANFAYVRENCMYSLLNNALDFHKHNQWPINIFEIDKGYIDILSCGKKAKTWTTDTNHQNTSIFDLKNVINKLKHVLSIEETGLVLDNPLFVDAIKLNNGIVGRLRFVKNFDLDQVNYARIKIMPVMNTVIQRNMYTEYYDISITTNHKWFVIHNLISPLLYRLSDTYTLPTGEKKYNFTVFNRNDYNIIIQILNTQQIKIN